MRFIPLHRAGSRRMQPMPADQLSVGAHVPPGIVRLGWMTPDTGESRYRHAGLEMTPAEARDLAKRLNEYADKAEGLRAAKGR